MHTKRDTAYNSRCCDGKRCVRCWRNKLKHTTKKNRFTSHDIEYPGLDKREILLFGPDANHEVLNLDRELFTEHPDLTKKEYLAWRKPLVQRLNELRWEAQFFKGQVWELCLKTYGKHSDIIYNHWRNKLKKKHGEAYLPKELDVGVFKWKTIHNNWNVAGLHSNAKKY